jgi:hypothetical protein
VTLRGLVTRAVGGMGVSVVGRESGALQQAAKVDRKTDLGGNANVESIAIQTAVIVMEKTCDQVTTTVPAASESGDVDSPDGESIRS